MSGQYPKASETAWNEPFSLRNILLNIEMATTTPGLGGDYGRRAEKVLANLLLVT